MADASLIQNLKILRDRTGAGMMDCKKALEENGNDIEKSIDWLREKGIAKQAKRAGRTAAEGKAGVKACDKCGKGVVYEVNCETDFVSASDKFIALSEAVKEYLMNNEPKDLEEAKAGVAQVFTDTALACGEKLDFRRYAIVHKTAEQGFGSYIHMGGKIATLVVIEKNDPELAQGLAMHIAANNPGYIKLEDVPAADRERETQIAKTEVAEDPKLVNKPDNVKAMIVEKKVEKTLSQSCLVFQAYLLDDSKTVGQVLKEKGNSVVSFVRFQVGEGIQKEEAAE